MVFANRRQAAELLADALAAYKGRHPPILAIPRGAVAMGQQLARALGSELDGVLVHKLRALICAVPVAPPDTLEKTRPYADEVVCLHAPAFFRAVGQFYAHFPQMDDSEVEAILRQAGA
jgi:putative phosphoribosyl transferase